MTYIRKWVQRSNVYLYSAMNYRDPDTEKVRQEATYLGKDVDVNGERSVKHPLTRRACEGYLTLGHT
ncbi:MAG: hypothetical protein QXU18_00170 [Thermoplasmatales archaeon]